ncbi:hypothetical protein ILYODFUR_034967 [Ilyodon furcidens]|uniref:Uncharacterized protein n=1 Tax=Ilyodon furcidens TaxID=33524 RepID=A0ABV0UAW5_9TELE
MPHLHSISGHLPLVFLRSSTAFTMDHKSITGEHSTCLSTLDTSRPKETPKTEQCKTGPPPPPINNYSGAGAVLSQRASSDNKMHPWTFFSKRFFPLKGDIGLKQPKNRHSVDGS